jgi:ribosome assembly protein 4
MSVSLIVAPPHCQTVSSEAADTCCMGNCCRYEAACGGRPERLASGSDDFTLFLWEPASSAKPLARMTGHLQLINQVGPAPDQAPSLQPAFTVSPLPPLDSAPLAGSMRLSPTRQTN